MGGEKKSSRRIGDAGAVVRAVRNLRPVQLSDSQAEKDRRRELAEFCKLLGEVFTGTRDAPATSQPPRAPQVNDSIAGLSPRVQQTLLRMLAGDSEKEIAIRLGVSKHTIHVYVKALYRHFAVNSRGELLARFVDTAFRQKEDVN